VVVGLKDTLGVTAGDKATLGVTVGVTAGVKEVDGGFVGRGDGGAD